jgi:uncharacterized protein involved in exopolysaccharide biosynthesis
LAATPAEALYEFRGHLSLSAEDPKILEDLLGPSQAGDAMAFSLTFLDPSPQVARDVARDLVDLYLEENQRARREQAEQTSRFLTQERERLEVEIDDREESLAAFKAKHAGGLPNDFDRDLIDRVERDLQSVDQEIRSLRDRRAMYSSELAQLSPHAPVVDEEGQNILGPDERRTLLERRYSQLSAIYSQDHPDVLKVRREIAALRSTGYASASDGGALQAELAARQEELAAARSRYSADHPDVQRLERTVNGLRAALTQAATLGTSSTVPDNPQYVQRKLQLEATESELQLALARRNELGGRLTQFEQRAVAAPEVEREFNALNRGYEQLLAQYDDVERKLREAEIAVNLESEGRGDRFTTIEPPQLPSSPERPNRLAVLLLTLITALTLGACGVALAERADTTIRHPRDVAEHLGMPPLVAIPFVANAADVRRHVRRRVLVTAIGCLWLGAIAFLIVTPA